eukprot:6492605-Amphidinium_carterae.2
MEEETDQWWESYEAWMVTHVQSSDEEPLQTLLTSTQSSSQAVSTTTTATLDAAATVQSSTQSGTDSMVPPPPQPNTPAPQTPTRRPIEALTRAGFAPIRARRRCSVCARHVYTFPCQYCIRAVCRDCETSVWTINGRDGPLCRWCASPFPLTTEEAEDVRRRRLRHDPHRDHDALMTAAPPHTISWASYAVQSDSELVMILDTACQRSVCGPSMHKRLKQTFLVSEATECERFSFGKGQSVSHVRLGFHATLVSDSRQSAVNVCCSVVDSELPLLISRSALTALGGVLDLGDHTLRCMSLPQQPHIPLIERGGHLACTLYHLEDELEPPIADPTRDLLIPASTTLLAQNEPAEWPMSQSIRMTPQHLQAEQLILTHTPRLAYSRTNVTNPSGAVIRSTALGGYTQRGVGITNDTYKHTQLLQALHVVAQSRQGEINIPYAAISVTSGQTPWHVDQNDGATTLTAIGDYKGGQLILQLPDKNTKTFSVKRKWLLFQACHRHSTAPSEGTRLALSYYVPKMHHKLYAHKDELLRLGFPVEHLWSSSSSSSTLAASARHAHKPEEQRMHVTSSATARSCFASIPSASRSHVDQLSVTFHDDAANIQPPQYSSNYQLVGDRTQASHMGRGGGDCLSDSLALCYSGPHPLGSRFDAHSPFNGDINQPMPPVDSKSGCCASARAYDAAASAGHSTNSIPMRASQWQSQAVQRRKARIVPQVHDVCTSMEMGRTCPTSCMATSAGPQGREHPQENSTDAVVATDTSRIHGWNVSHGVQQRRRALDRKEQRENFLPPAKQIRRGWQRELGVLRKVHETYSTCAGVMQQQWEAMHQSRLPSVIVGGGHGLISTARKHLSGSVHIASTSKALPTDAEDKMAFFVIADVADASVQRTRTILSLPWHMLGMIVKVDLAHSLHKAKQLTGHYLQHLGDWMWITNERSLRLDANACNGEDTRQMIEHALCAFEQRRLQISHARPCIISQGHIKDDAPGTHHVHWQDANKNDEDWRNILADSEAQLEARPSLSLWEPPTTGAWRDQLSQLVPWRIEKAYVVRAPKVRRLPNTFPYTHRGATVVFNDNSIAIETEQLDANTIPRQRFSKPVRFAIFFYGVSLDELPVSREEADQQRVPPGDQPPALRPTPGESWKVADGVYFRVDRNRIPLAVCQLVYKLHCQLAHLNKNELAKLLASHGANPTTLSAVAGMDCSTCNRHKPVPPPRPASVPQPFAFAESLQADVFFVMDSLGENHMILGIIDASTHLHVAQRIERKDARAMLQTFLQMWVSSFGVPQELKTDADPAFRGTFAEGCGRLGIELIHIPADRHAQLGRIERHNAILRLALLKLITEHTVHTTEDLDITLQSAVSAKNTLASWTSRC